MINGKEAKEAFKKGIKIEWMNETTEWTDFNQYSSEKMFECNDLLFRLKRESYQLNELELPKPYKPNDGDTAYHLCSLSEKGYSRAVVSDENRFTKFKLGAWDTKSDIEKVVRALTGIKK